MILRVPTLVLPAVHAACGGSTCERKANVCDLLCEEEEGGGASPAIEEMPKNQFQRGEFISNLTGEKKRVLTWGKSS